MEARVEPEWDPHPWPGYTEINRRKIHHRDRLRNNKANCRCCWWARKKLFKIVVCSKNRELLTREKFCWYFKGNKAWRKRAGQFISPDTMEYLNLYSYSKEWMWWDWAEYNKNCNLYEESYKKSRLLSTKDEYEERVRRFTKHSPRDMR